MDLNSIKDKFSEELNAHIVEEKGRRKRYSVSFKKAVTSCLRGGLDRHFLCNELNIPLATVSTWVSLDKDKILKRTPPALFTPVVVKNTVKEFLQVKKTRKVVEILMAEGHTLKIFH